MTNNNPPKKKIKLKKLSEIISRCWEQTIKLDLVVEKKGRWFVLGQRIKLSAKLLPDCQMRTKSNNIYILPAFSRYQELSWPMFAIWINCFSIWLYFVLRIFVLHVFPHLLLDLMCRRLVIRITIKHVPNHVTYFQLMYPLVFSLSYSHSVYQSASVTKKLFFSY